MKRDFTISAAWTAASSWVEQGAGVVIFITIARLIGVSGFGVASLAFAFLFLGEYLVRDTITEAIIERKTLEEGRLEATFVILMGFSIAICLALCALSPLAAAIYRRPQVGFLLIAASPTVLMLGVAGVSTALLRRKLAYRTLAIRSMSGTLCGGVVGVAMAANGMGPWSLVGQRLTEIGFNSIFAIHAAGWIPKRWPTRAELGLVRGLGPRVVLLRSIGLVINQTATVTLGIVADPRAAGIYAFAWRLVELTGFLIVKPLMGVAQSALAAMRREHASTAQFYLDITELASMCAFAAYAGLALIAEPIVLVMLGPAWKGAAAILPALCAAGAVASLSSIQEAYLLAHDRLQAYLAVAFFEAAAGVALIAFAGQYGAAAVGGAVAVRALAALPLRTRATLATESIAPMRFIRTQATPALLVCGMAVPVALWRLAAYGRMPNIVFLASAIAIGVGAVAIMLFRLMPNALARVRTFVQH